MYVIMPEIRNLMQAVYGLMDYRNVLITIVVCRFRSTVITDQAMESKTSFLDSVWIEYVCVCVSESGQSIDRLMLTEMTWSN